LFELKAGDERGMPGGLQDLVRQICVYVPYHVNCYALSAARIERATRAFVWRAVRAYTHLEGLVVGL
jgi:hypothetical protein